MLAGFALVATTAFAVPSIDASTAVPVRSAAVGSSDPVRAAPSEPDRAAPSEPDRAAPSEPDPPDYDDPFSYPRSSYPAHPHSSSPGPREHAEDPYSEDPSPEDDPHPRADPRSEAATSDEAAPATPPEKSDEAKPEHPVQHRPARKTVEIAAVQRRLRELHYAPGPANGVYGEFTKNAIWAFQKVNGMAPTGRMSKRFMRALQHPRRPRHLTHDRSRNRVDIDVRHQVLTVYRGGGIAMISHISTGSGRHYCEKGHCGIAHTPIGDFRVTRRISGWHRSPLGYMYRPLFFHLGYAMHGSLQVPNRRASHGCVRLPMNVGDRIPSLVRNGTPVHVRA